MLYQSIDSWATFQEQKACWNSRQVRSSQRSSWNWWTNPFPAWDWTTNPVPCRFCGHLEHQAVRSESQNCMDEGYRRHGATNKARKRESWPEKLLRMAPLAIRKVKSRPKWIQGKSRRINGKASKELKGRKLTSNRSLSEATVSSGVKIESSEHEPGWNK